MEKNGGGIKLWITLRTFEEWNIFSLQILWLKSHTNNIFDKWWKNLENSQKHIIWSTHWFTIFLSDLYPSRCYPPPLIYVIQFANLQASVYIGLVVSLYKFLTVISHKWRIKMNHVHLSRTDLTFGNKMCCDLAGSVGSIDCEI